MREERRRAPRPEPTEGKDLTTKQKRENERIRAAKALADWQHRKRRQGWAQGATTTGPKATGPKAENRFQSS